MNRPLTLSAALLLVAASFVAGSLWRQGAAPAATAEKASEYVCPMHPRIRSGRPGDCPSCGMKLELAHASAAVTAGPPLAPGAVQVSPEQQQAVGVRLGVAERVQGTRLLRTTGRVAADENATYPIVAGASGWIRSVASATTGTRVRKNEVLASFYAPEFAPAQQAYFAAVETVGRVNSQQMQAFNQTRVAEGVQRLADTLRNLGVSEGQLAEMARTRTLVQDIHLVSPVDGFVLQRSVSPGLRFDRGFELYRIADLRRVWVLADVYQHQLPFIHAGMTTRATTAQAERPFPAVVSRAEPVFDEATLTLKVRLDADNPGFVLKPGMFVDVELPIELPPTIAVPADAIVDSGLRRTVFVDRGGGSFEPRQVETGWRVGELVEVVRGLMPGERIVLSGTFLIDSESRMRMAAQAGETVEDPVCGMRIERSPAGGRPTAQYGGTSYSFCSEDCRQAFEKNPQRYLKRADPAQGRP